MLNSFFSIENMEVIQANTFCDDVKHAWLKLERYGTLFNSYYWLKTWWETWGEGRLLELHILIVRENEKAIALLPLYKELSTNRNANNYQFLGNIYPNGETILSEYTDMLIEPNKIEQARKAISELLRQLNFIRITLPFATSKNLFLQISQPELNCVSKNILPAGYAINTNQSFELYKATLGKNTRLKLFNRRTLLKQKYPSAKLTHASSLDEISSYLGLLNKFHAIRWGTKCFNDQSLSFHSAVAEHFLVEERLKLSLLSVDEKPVSILYNLRFGESEYNIQAGYLESFDTKISLGILHLGYAIESAFKSSSVQRFDMLMGHGKNTDYKTHLGKLKTEFNTFTIHKNKLTKLEFETLRFAKKLKQKLTTLFDP